MSLPVNGLNATRAFVLGAIMLSAAVPLAAQERGTVELGAFGSYFASGGNQTLHRGTGGGGLVGIYLDERIALEFEAVGMRATRTGGFPDANVGILGGRIVWTPIVAGPLSLHLGGGGGSLETSFLHTYTSGAMVGFKVALSDNVAIRADALVNWWANYNWTPDKRVNLGLSFYRHPDHPAPVMVAAAAPATPPMRARVDTVYRVRVDTVMRARVDSVRIMEPSPDQLVLRVQFETNKTTLLQRSRPVLDTIAKAILATPGSKWEVQGHTDSVGTAAANKTLAQGRAQSVVDYLVTKGVDRTSLTASGFGQERPVFSNSTVYGRAQNRRVQLRRIPPPPTGVPVK
jgi:outer membrane protein OmpA-like peptidoglycan-associated protein